MQSKITYRFTAELWQHDAAGGWHFVSLPQDISREIRQHFGWQEEGWGRLKARAVLGDHSWDTAIWFDTKRDTYLLPIKAAIRKKGKLVTGQLLSIDLYI